MYRPFNCRSTIAPYIRRLFLKILYKKVLCYGKVQASDIEEAKQQILAHQSDIKIRAVNLVDSH